MAKVLVYSLLLIVGLVASQFLDGAGAAVIQPLTMFGLAFIMIHVGYEFEIDKNDPGQYAWDYVVAATAAGFPWILCALYFVFALAPREIWQHPDLWKETLLQARFAAPTSAGVLFSMLAAAGLAATWVFRKARILAIFDDLDTVLLMIPLKMLMVGVRWQLGVVIVIMGVLLWIGWRYLREIRLPVSWPFVLAYALVITAVCEAIHLGSALLDATVPVHIEVLLPAFVLGCILARPAGHDPHVDDAVEGHEIGLESPTEQRVATIVSACFMVLVGLSMPPIQPRAVNRPELVEHTPAWFADVAPEVLERKYAFPGWGMVAVHVLAITVLSNLGKMFATLCYRDEASFRERLAISIGMFPRGEVGAGVLVASLAYGLKGPVITIAVLSLALNLLFTGVFILIVKKLLAPTQSPAIPT